MTSRPIEQAVPARVRIMTYNVHGCRGLDRLISTRRIADVIASANPDIVALQELDVGRVRSDKLDQAEAIAKYLGMNFQFSPAVRVLEEQYGDAILTALPSRLIKAAALPGIRFPRLEPRGALWTEISVHGVKLQMLTTHLGLIRRERVAQAEALTGAGWLSHPDCQGPKILAGDFNFLSRSRAHAKISGIVKDTHQAMPRAKRHATFPARFPRFRIDYIFASPSIQVERVETVRTGIARIASDHLPLIADLKLPARAVESRGEEAKAFTHA